MAIVYVLIWSVFTATDYVNTTPASTSIEIPPLRVDNKSNENNETTAETDKEHETTIVTTEISPRHAETRHSTTDKAPDNETTDVYKVAYATISLTETSDAVASTQTPVTMETAYTIFSKQNHLTSDKGSEVLTESATNIVVGTCTCDCAALTRVLTILSVALAFFAVGVLGLALSSIVKFRQQIKVSPEYNPNHVYEDVNDIIPYYQRETTEHLNELSNSETKTNSGCSVAQRCKPTTVWRACSVKRNGFSELNQIYGCSPTFGKCQMDVTSKGRSWKAGSDCKQTDFEENFHHFNSENVRCKDLSETCGDFFNIPETACDCSDIAHWKGETKSTETSFSTASACHKSGKAGSLKDYTNSRNQVYVLPSGQTNLEYIDMTHGTKSMEPVESDPTMYQSRQTSTLHSGQDTAQYIDMTSTTRNIMHGKSEGATGGSEYNKYELVDIKNIGETDPNHTYEPIFNRRSEKQLISKRQMPKTDHDRNHSKCLVDREMYKTQKSCGRCNAGRKHTMNRLYLAAERCGHAMSPRRLKKALKGLQDKI